MEEYIKKSAILAEIEKRKIPFKKDIDNGVYPTYLCALMDFEDFIDTLEVKEEILDSNDIKEAFKSGYDMGVIQTTKKINSNTKKVDLDLEITLWANAIPEIRLDDVERLAKHFFELGQNHAWSEDDEMIALNIEQVMNCASLLNIVPEKIDKIRTWLKSLKERI